MTMIHHGVLVACLCAFQVQGLPPVIKIGAIFTQEQRDSSAELAFKYAVHRVNKDKHLLPQSTLVYDIQYVTKDDSFHACKKACQQVGEGVQAVFGPSNPTLGAHVHSICDALDLPHIESRVDPETTARELSINLHPSQPLLNTAFQDVMTYLNWTRLAILYEEDYGLMKLKELVRSPEHKSVEILLRQADFSNYKSVLKEVKTKEIHNLLVDIKTENIRFFLKRVIQLQMNDYKYHYLFTTFDLESLSLDEFKYNFVNMTAFRIVNIDDLTVKEIFKDMDKFNNRGTARINRTKIIESEPALIYDSVMVFVIGLQTLEQSHPLLPANVSCTVEKPWDGGLSLINYINSVEVRGLSGPIAFKEGRRTLFKLDVVKLKQHSVVKVGEWNPESGLNISDSGAFFDTASMNVTLVVITILEEPYVMMYKTKNYTGNARFFGFCIDVLHMISKEVGFDYIIELVPDKKYGAQDPATKQWNGIVGHLMRHETPYVMMNEGHDSKNDRFVGFCIDLLRLVSVIAGFKYTLKLVPDGKYGVYDPVSGEWNGIVRQLMDKKADLAVGSMTINYARESVIDFTKPFMNLGISILFKVPAPHETKLFSFMKPLAIDIWLYVLAAYILVSITMFIVARFSPYEWHNPHACDTENDLIENQFSLSNSFWFTIGTLMQQGSDLNPKATSTRIVGGIWWFFTLIIISSYTANLAAFLTVERMITPIENAEDLASQSEIAYGTLEGGSTMTFFRDSMIETYKKMWRFMENKKVFVSTYEEGIKRVLEGNYAFLMESSMLEYIVQRNCNLTQIGGLLDTKGYGLATPMGSPWRDRISLAILELQEKGEIQMLYDKWWKNTGDTCVRKDKSRQSKANSLGVDNIGGIFVVLLCGLAIAVLIAIFEFCYNSKRNAQFERRGGAQSLCSEMVDELRFALKCRGSRQRPALKRQCSRCSSAPSYIQSVPPAPPAPPQLPSYSQPQRSGVAVSLDVTQAVHHNF